VACTKKHALEIVELVGDESPPANPECEGNCSFLVDLRRVAKNTGRVQAMCDKCKRLIRIVAENDE
jgi:hypothetical protein